MRRHSPVRVAQERADFINRLGAQCLGQIRHGLHLAEEILTIQIGQLLATERKLRRGITGGRQFGLEHLRDIWPDIRQQPGIWVQLNRPHILPERGSILEYSGRLVLQPEPKIIEIVAVCSRALRKGSPTHIGFITMTLTTIASYPE